MGYNIKDIAIVEEPKKVTLGNISNFVIFKPKVTVYTNSNMNISILTTYAGSVEYPEQTVITFIQLSDGTKKTFRGTNNKNNVGNNIFYLDTDRTIVARNLAECIKKDSWFNANFDIEVPFNYNGTIVSNGNTINIISKGGGSKYTFSASTYDNTFCSTAGTPSVSTNNDSFDNGNGNTSIELEIYKDNGIFLGVSDIPDSNSLGTYVTTLSKFYYKDNVWYDTNAIASKMLGYSNSFLNTEDWTDAGTMMEYRYIARLNNSSSIVPFYISNVLYVINGYDYTLNENNISDYIYSVDDNNVVYPLTNNRFRNYINGQSEYFNFILNDSNHNNSIDDEFNFELLYKYYTYSKDFIASVEKSSKSRMSMNMVNTIKVNTDIDTIENKYNKTVGYIEVFLIKGDGNEISYPICYDVAPECLNEIKSFAFLNRLGGWDSFNFNGVTKTDFNPKDVKTLYKTQLPDYNISSEVESVYSKTNEEYYTVTSSVIDYTTMDWLRELADSKVVYEVNSKRYVIVDEMKMEYNDDDNSFQVSMKYHYSGRYNNTFA